MHHIFIFSTRCLPHYLNKRNIFLGFIIYNNVSRRQIMCLVWLPDTECSLKRQPGDVGVACTVAKI